MSFSSSLTCAGAHPAPVDVGLQAGGGKKGSRASGRGRKKKEETKKKEMEKKIRFSFA